VAFHLGPGPVFQFECLTSSRRWQHFAGRVFCISLLLAALCWVAVGVSSRSPGSVGLRELATAGEKFYLAITITQLSLLLLVAPAVAADAICLDKARGALLPLLTTDLSSREIILGKLLARYLPIVGYVFCSLPVLAICFSLGGIEPEIAFGSFFVCLGTALVCGTLAVLLSIWCTKTYEVLLVTYMIEIAFLLLLLITRSLPAGTIVNQLATWAENSNPFYLSLAPYLLPGSVRSIQFGHYFFGCLALTAILVVIAMCSLRPAVVHFGFVRSRKRQVQRRRWLPRFTFLPTPSLDGNPILWREWHRRQPSRWIRGVWIVYGLAGGGFGLMAFLQSVLNAPYFLRELEPFVCAFLSSIGLLLISVTSVTSLQDERVRGSLDVLLTSPLSSGEILWGKWWGSYRAVLLLAVLPTMVAMGPWVRGIWSTIGGTESADFQALSFLLMPLMLASYGAATVSLGLALAIWIKRTSRAMAASVICYLVPTVGLLLGPALSHDEYASCLGSSFMAAGYVTVECERAGAFQGNFVTAILGWCITYALVAACFAIVGYRSFDRCLDRVPEKPMDRVLTPWRKHGYA
jgi:ABC-type transport system involved in multi-copper enzyme maturation permease subunit